MHFPLGVILAARDGASANLQAWGVLANAVGTLIIGVTLIRLVTADRRLAATQRMDNLQRMVVEMNALRRLRSEHPELERSLFEARSTWTDAQIQHNLMAVQLANILEWAYLSRREGLLDKDVWESWVETWRIVILASEPLRQDFVSSVWTFGRSPDVIPVLQDLVASDNPIPDPADGRGIRRHWRRLRHP
jgi:hypothetical protein